MIKVDWFEDMGHNSIYVHVFENDQNNTIWSCHDYNEISDMITDGFMKWEDDESIIAYLRELGIIKSNAEEMEL